MADDRQAAPVNSIAENQTEKAPPFRNAIIACVGDDTCNEQLSRHGFLEASPFSDDTRAQAGSLLIWVADAACAAVDVAAKTPSCLPSNHAAPIGAVAVSLEVDGHDYSELLNTADGSPAPTLSLDIGDLADALSWDVGHHAVVKIGLRYGAVKRYVSFSFLYGWLVTAPDPDFPVSWDHFGFWFPIGLFGLGKNDIADPTMDGPVRVLAIPVALAFGFRVRTWKSDLYIGLSGYVAPSVLGPSGSGIAQSIYAGGATGLLLDLDGKVEIGGARNCFVGAGPDNGCGWFVIVGSPLLNK